MAKKKMKIKIKPAICTLLTLISLGASAYLIYNILLLGPIEQVIRYIIVGVIVLIDISIYLKNFKLLHKKNKNVTLFIILMTLFIIFNVGIGLVINKVYSSIDNINKNSVTYSSSLITLSTSKIDNIKTIKNKKIGISTNTTSIENNTIPKEMIEKYNLDDSNEIVEYDDLGTMLSDLYSSKIDAMFIDTNYETMFNTTKEYTNISTEVKIITSQVKTIKKSDSDTISSNTNSLTKPFTILLMGVDSEVEGLEKNSNVHGDSLILITFNPNTLNATMLTIPRDSYVPIVCLKNKKELKLTQAAWYGSECMTNSIENFLDVNIDYYVKINFKGVVGLVNALGGVDVEVPKDLCTDNSDRGSKVCIKAGLQHLDGEGALVLARNRYDLTNGDLDRGTNQQTLLKAMLQKIKTVSSFSKITDILDTISNNVDTNLTTTQILSFYNIGKDIISKTLISDSTDVVNIEQLYLQGTGQMIYESMYKLTMWDYILNEESVADVTKAMKINLELEDAELIKTFSFSINDPYVQTITGKGPYNNSTKYSLLPDLLGKTKSYVESWATKNNVKVTYKTVTDNSSTYSNNQVVAQSYPKNTKLSTISNLTISILQKTTSSKINCSDSDNLSNSTCQIPSFIGMTKTEVTNWFSKFEKYSNYTYEEVTTNDYPNATVGTIVAQNYKVSTHLSKVSGLVLKIVTK